MGVYQGTSLGPFLYNVSYADLSLYIEHAKIFQYADDTQLLITGQKTELPSMVRRMESALGTVCQWFAQNHMKLNAAKSQLLVLGNPKILERIHKITLSMQNATIHESDTIRNLGLTMDRSLSYDMHVKSVCGSRQMHRYIDRTSSCQTLRAKTSLTGTNERSRVLPDTLLFTDIRQLQEGEPQRPAESGEFWRAGGIRPEKAGSHE